MSWRCLLGMHDWRKGRSFRAEVPLGPYARWLTCRRCATVELENVSVLDAVEGKDEH